MKISDRAGSSTSFLRQLADYAYDIHYATLPKKVCEEVKTCVLDTVGCIASGAHEPDSIALLEAERSFGGAGEASVFGRRERMSVLAAARINAYMGDIYELNDLMSSHASIAIIPPALALAERHGIGGQRVIEAVAAGIEVTFRIHAAFYPHQKPFTETGMVQLALSSPVGAATCAAKLLGLNRSQLADAMTSAAALAGWCPAEIVFGQGSPIKPMMFGASPASVGIVSAVYARYGLHGSDQILESPIGYYATVARQIDRDVLLDTQRWYLERPRRKLHACCGYIHSAADGLAALMHAGTDMSRVAAIRVSVPGYTMPAVAKTGPPLSANEARFHLQYCLAQIAAGSDVVLPQHSINAVAEMANKPQLKAIMEKISVLEEPSYTHYQQSSVALLDKGGDVFAKTEISAPRGSESNPLTPNEIRAKFMRLTAPFASEAWLARYVERVAGLDRETDCSWLLRAFVDQPC
jgi:2-methylcitrate dehydratase PrpD